MSEVTELPVKPSVATVPDLTPDEKLMLKTLESSVLTAQLDAQQKYGVLKDEQRAFQDFVNGLFKSRGISAPEWQLDVKGMKFVSQPTPSPVQP